LDISQKTINILIKYKLTFGIEPSMNLIKEKKSPVAARYLMFER